MKTNLNVIYVTKAYLHKIFIYILFKLQSHFTVVAFWRRLRDDFLHWTCFRVWFLWILIKRSLLNWLFSVCKIEIDIPFLGCRKNAISHCKLQPFLIKIECCWKIVKFTMFLLFLHLFERYCDTFESSLKFKKGFESHRIRYSNHASTRIQIDKSAIFIFALKFHKQLVWKCLSLIKISHALVFREGALLRGALSHPYHRISDFWKWMAPHNLLKRNFKVRPTKCIASLRHYTPRKSITFFEYMH